MIGIRVIQSISIKSKVINNQSLSIARKKRGLSPKWKRVWIPKIYFVNIELFTPACSHFLITGLKNDIGSAVKTANETTSIKSVVKWFIPKSVPASQSQGNAEANKEVSIGSV